MKHPTLMVQGTTSDAGKSLLVTALGRWLSNQSIRVAPFKPQNMALNSAVSIDGGEIGRAQAVQALACNVDPHSDMNPILLKPNSDVGCQVIVQGQVLGDIDANEYQHYKERALTAVLESYQRLTNRYEVILVEGAGSPAEINLRKNDIANMGFAEAVDCPVILIADIDRGGVFAQLKGTLDLLSPSEQTRIKGFVINRFRGDRALLQSGLEWLTHITKKPVLGVLPYLHGLHLQAEDAISAVDPRLRSETQEQQLRVVVPVFPRISNHTDFDPLRLHPEVELLYIGPGDAIPAGDLIILPGSKNVRADLAWLRQQGWESAILRHLRYHGKLLGICGGYQMLGKKIHDPHGVEGEPGTSDGLGLLDVETTLQQRKHLQNVNGRLLLDTGRTGNGAIAPEITGYEIHAGVSYGSACANPLLYKDDGHQDGAISGDNHIAATYLHGLFEKTDACNTILTWAGLKPRHTIDYDKIREASLERLSSMVDCYLDTQEIKKLLTLDHQSL